MIGIVVSEADEASVTIGEQLLNLAEWSTHDGGERFLRSGMELRRFADLHLSLSGVADAFEDPDVIVFVSRHAGETGPLLTAHFPGNVGDAAYGGSPHELPAAAPGPLRTVYHRLRDDAPPGYGVGIECTHHGPSSVGAPCMFVEVGSGPEQWRDARAAESVARAVLALGALAVDRPNHTVVGIGGGHYAPRFERILADTGWAVGHVAADWALDELPDRETERTVLSALFQESGTELAVCDGIAEACVERVESLGYRVVSESWIRETDGVDLELVAAIEDLAGPVAEGTRIGSQLDVTSDELRTVTYPDELIAELQAADRSTAIETVAGSCTAYGTTENGNRLTGDVVLSDSTDPRELVEAVRPLLEDRYETVAWDGDALTVRTRSFDPSRARELGVPEGPAFGRLANGDRVTVGDTVIEPEQVSSEEERKIPALPG